MVTSRVKRPTMAKGLRWESPFWGVIWLAFSVPLCLIRPTWWSASSMQRGNRVRRLGPRWAASTRTLDSRVFGTDWSSGFSWLALWLRCVSIWRPVDVSCPRTDSEQNGGSTTASRSIWGSPPPAPILRQRSDDADFVTTVNFDTYDENCSIY